MAAFPCQVKKERERFVCFSVQNLPSGKVTNTFNASDAAAIFTEDLKKALVRLRDGELGPQRYYLKFGLNKRCHMGQKLLRE